VQRASLRGRCCATQPPETGGLVIDQQLQQCQRESDMEGYVYPPKQAYVVSLRQPYHYSIQERKIDQQLKEIGQFRLLCGQSDEEHRNSISGKDREVYGPSVGRPYLCI